MTLTIEQALTIVARARTAAAAMNAKPLGYAIVDAGGHPLVIGRDERAGFLRATVAVNKAWGCFAMGVSSGRLADSIKGWASWFVGLQGAAGGRLLPSPGGVFIRDANGAAIGAMGVSGETSANDLAIATRAITEAGLAADDTQL